MNEVSDNGEPVEKVGWFRQAVLLVLPFVFVAPVSSIFPFFEKYLNFYVFFFLWLLLFMVIQFLPAKRKTQPFDFKDLPKMTGFLILAALIFYNVVNTMISLAEIIPEWISAWFPAILITGAVLYLIGLGIHFIEKHSKI